MAIHLTNRELDVMSVIWRLGSATVAEVRSGLHEGLAYTTVLTVLRGLESKGYVRHEASGKAFRYHPLIEATEVGEGALGRLLDKIYRGSREMLIARLVADEDISEEELLRIRELLDKRLDEVDR
ncbi:MAG: BlaI/MecI/CopY family transcriptional regulator [Gemmatimonadales bacterium]